MILIVDDTSIPTRLKLIKNNKIILKKEGTIKSLLRYVYKNTKNDSLKQSIQELQAVYMFMLDSKTRIEIK